MSLLNLNSFRLNTGMAFLLAWVSSFKDFPFELRLLVIGSGIVILPFCRSGNPWRDPGILGYYWSSPVTLIRHLSNPSYPWLKNSISIISAWIECSNVHKDKIFTTFPRIFHKTKSCVFLRYSKWECSRNSLFLKPLSVALPLLTWIFLLGWIKEISLSNLDS